FLLNLCVAAVENDRYAGTRFSTLSSVCSYKTFPLDEEFDDYDADDQSDFLLDLYSHLKIYETQTGRSFLPALQSLTEKELRPPGSAETTNTEETSRSERIDEFPSVSALHLTAEVRKSL
ncbi:hypothetical protein M9458_007614, partial [Cirrhinus mrigala]